MKRVLTLLFLLLSHSAFAGEWVPGVIHLHTRLGEGDGVFTPLELVEKVREKGLGVAIINDHDNERVEYGLFPLRRIIRKVVERNSITRYGVEEYLREMEKARRAYPDVILIPGIEAVPAYYWERGPLEEDPTLRNWHKHLLIMGLEKPEDIEGLPSVGRGWPSEIGFGCLLGLWPLILIPAGIFLIRLKRTSIISFSGMRFREVRRPYRFAGYTVLGLSILFLVNNFPFCRPPYDPYHGDPGIGPYQEVIDYVRERGGLVFWAHPEATFDLSFNGIRIFTPPHPEDLLRSKGYTGFAALLEGRGISRPGGMWDGLLKQYMEGERESPVWAIGELDYREGDWMGETQTVFFLEERSEEGVLKALREGRVYAVTGLPNKPRLEHFEVWDGVEGRWKMMGDTAVVRKRVRIRLALNYQGRKGLTVRLIREGRVVRTWPLRGTLRVEWEEPAPQRTYYRIDVIEKEPLLISNPIFVKRVE